MKFECDVCKKVFKRNRNIVLIGNKFKCHLCRSKEKSTILMTKLPKPRISEKFALDKIYQVMPKVCGNNLTGRTRFPRVLIGKYFKLKLIDKKEIKQNE